MYSWNTIMEYEHIFFQVHSGSEGMVQGGHPTVSSEARKYESMLLFMWAWEKNVPFKEKQDKSKHL